MVTKELENICKKCGSTKEEHIDGKCPISDDEKFLYEETPQPQKESE